MLSQPHEQGPMRNVLRRVAIAVSVVLAAVLLWARRVAGPSQRERLVEKATVVRMPRGEALEARRFVLRGTDSRLEQGITPGKRAMSFRVDDVSGIAKHIGPNGRVDILVVVDAGAEKRRIAKVFMENVRLLTIGSVPGRGADLRALNAAVATVEVTPEEGERIAIATTRGPIQLMVRGYGAGAAATPATLPR